MTWLDWLVFMVAAACIGTAAGLIYGACSRKGMYWVGYAMTAAAVAVVQIMVAYWVAPAAPPERFVLAGTLIFVGLVPYSWLTYEVRNAPTIDPTTTGDSEG